MICPKCTRPPEDYFTGEWVHKTIDGHPRMVCRTCGYVDDRRVWVGGIYHGPPEKLRGYKKDAGSVERKTR